MKLCVRTWFGTSPHAQLSIRCASAKWVASCHAQQEEQKDSLIALARERDEFELCAKELRARNSWLEKQVLGSPGALRYKAVCLGIVYVRNGAANEIAVSQDSLTSRRGFGSGFHHAHGRIYCIMSISVTEMDLNHDAGGTHRSVAEERVKVVAQTEEAGRSRRCETGARGGWTSLEGASRCRRDSSRTDSGRRIDPVSRLEHRLEVQQGHGRGVVEAGEEGRLAGEQTAMIRRNIQFLEDCDRYACLRRD